MRSRELALALVLLAASAAATEAPPPARPEVQQALDTVRQHPDMGGRKREKTLRLRPDDREKERKKEDEASGLDWLRDLVIWLADASRVLVWIVGAVLVALLLVGLRRWIQVRGGLLRPPRPHLPSHVQSLDIRPESLPPDIGAAAARLWQAGEQRQALSLLYRGALSRLVHAHGVAIRAASTEGECVALARQRLAAPRSAFFARLVAAWQLAVYGGRMPGAEQALALCREFEQQLPPAPPAGATP